MVNVIHLVLAIFIATSSASLFSMEEGCLPTNQDSKKQSRKIKSEIKEFKGSDVGKKLKKKIKKYTKKSPAVIKQFKEQLTHVSRDLNSNKRSEEDLFTLLYSVRDTYEGGVVLNKCIFNQNVLGVELLLLAGVDVNFDSSVYRNLQAPLINFAISPNIQILSLLLEFGADPNKCDAKKEWSPLRKLVFFNEPDYLTPLLKAGACIDDGAGTMPLLEFAQFCGRDEIVARLASIEPFCS